MAPHQEFYAHDYQERELEQPPILPPSPMSSTADISPPMGETPPQELAREAADGHRGAAWRFMIWILKNDPRAVVAVASQKDDRLAQHLLEFVALGTWAGKSFVVPRPLRSPYARTRLRTLFMSDAGMDSERARRILLAGIHADDPRMREHATYILGLVGGHNDVPVLLELLQDPSPNVRLQAVKALGTIGDATAVPYLLTLLHTADEAMSTQIFHSLVQFGVAAIPGVQAASFSKSAGIRWQCMRTLGEIADERAIPTLAGGLNDPDHGVAWMAARGLPQFGKLSVVPALQVMMTQEASPWLIETTSYVFRQVCDRYEKLEPYLEPMIQELHASSFKVATVAVATKTLARLEADNVLKRSIRHLSH